MIQVFNMYIKAREEFEEAKKDDNSIEMCMAEDRIRLLEEAIEALGLIDEFHKFLEVA